MEHKNSCETTATHGYTLPFTVEDQQFTANQQYLTGASIKRIAGLPKDAELFLTVSSPWKDDPINDDEEIDLARPGIEGFYIKKKLKFTIDGVERETDRQYLTEMEIKRIGCVPLDYQVFLFIEGPYEDELIEEGTRVNLARPGKEIFISKPKPIYTLIVNAQAKSWLKPTISFEQIVVLAFGVMSDESMKAYTVAYSNGTKSKPKGIMSKADVVSIQNDMKFDVSATDKS